MQDPTERLENSEQKAKIKYSRIKRKILKHVWALRLAILLFVVLILGTLGAFLFIALGNLKIGKIYDSAYNFIKAPIDSVSSSDGRINILVMGKAGEIHAGADLTDTMIVASIPLTKSTIDMFSIPRDLWIPEIRAKVNSAYYWGNQKKEGTGIILAKSIVENVVGIPIHYGIVVDFSGFKDVVNVLGGIKVKVQNSFVDEKYPLAGRENDLCGGDPEYKCRYETVSFEKGETYMDGETALKFVRSRNAEGDEGTDLAREARQQVVINAIKNKILSPEIFLNPKKLNSLRKIALDSLETDIDFNTFPVIARKLFDSRDSLKSYLIPEELLLNPPISATYDRQYVFIPKAGNGNWREINAWVKSVLN